MTEQPVETEEQFLGNVTKDQLREAARYGTTLPASPLQQYAPNAHLRRPAWSPVDDVELAALVRKSINANKLLAIAKSQAATAEDALSLALGVESEAYETANEAEQALLAFTRKDTGL